MLFPLMGTIGPLTNNNVFSFQNTLSDYII